MPSSFTDFTLCPELLQAVRGLGFKTPTPIQTLSIPPILAGRDLLGQAETGSGKTAAFGLPLLEKIRRNANMATRPRPTLALALSPTRELALQSTGMLASLAADLPQIKILPLYGGRPLAGQIRALKQGAQFVVGTPGRILDHLQRRTLNLETLQTLVLDEADKMLEMGFRDDLERILRAIPEQCQKICLSATMPDQMLNLLRPCLRDPLRLKTGPQAGSPPPSIEQTCHVTSAGQKYALLHTLLQDPDTGRAIVFCATRLRAEDLAARLRQKGLKAEALHGSLSQEQRELAVRRFRRGESRFLAATDVAARGLDMEGLDTVINLDLPADAESYIHRIGRTGRAGRAGRAISLITPRERAALRAISRHIRAEIAEAPPPSSIRQAENFATERLLAEARSKLTDLYAQSQRGKKMDRHELALSALLEEGGSPMQLAAVLFKMLMEKENNRANGGE
ncbi:MAG: DEAD/DEAH box helicase [Deltaproteobacteria bacterium]|jgi:ATP-dependent RNA helicase DeaD|nr:DEAD/DEAH box helicase [Deltaproteobacteria bacterium]